MLIRTLETQEEIRGCFPVMLELRPQLVEDEFVRQVHRQRAAHGYVLAAVESEGRIVAAAGYRVAEFMAWGKVLYVDDLVTGAAHRGKGYGGALMDWLVAQARAQGCAELHLDSGHQRFDAHRLYLNKKLRITSHHFALKLAP